MKTAIVAGASRGIGKSIAKALVDDGYFVIAISRNSDQLKSLCEYSENILPYQMDVTDSLATKAFSKFIEDKNIDVLVHNAGGNFEQNSMMDGNPLNWIKTYELNVIGPLNMSQAVVPNMKKNNCGKVIIITSVVGHTVTYPGGAAYTGTKHDEVVFVKNLRNEIRDNKISVTEIAPGTTNTETNRNSHAVDSTDIAEAVRWVSSLPSHVNVDSIIINPV